MRLLTSLLLFLFPFFLCGQVSDSFADGDITNNPEWVGDTAHFKVNSNEELRLDAPAATASSSLATPSKAIGGAVWEFLLRLDFNPSGSNYLDVAIASPTPVLDSAASAYFVRIGDTEDKVSLYRKEDSSEIELIEGTEDKLDTDPVTLRVRVTRSGTGQFTLLTDSSGGTNFTSEGSVHDEELQKSSYFSIRCDYTSTRADKFFFDDIAVTGSPFQDSIPPELDSLFAKERGRIRLIYDEALDSTSFTRQDIHLAPEGGMPDSLESADQNRSIRLHYPPSLSNDRDYTLEVPSVKDTAGNPSEALDTSFRYLISEPPEKGELRINEVLFDPLVGGSDFVECYNASERILDMGSCRFARYRDSISDPEPVGREELLLRPGEHRFFSEGIEAVRTDYPAAVPEQGVELSRLPSYLKDSGTVVLLDGKGELLDRFSYNAEMHHPLLNDPKGVSLERIDPTAPTQDPNNWHSAAASEGHATPGYRNSQYMEKKKEKEATLWTEPRVFSPDMDGERDLLRIHYRFSEPGMSCSISIHDPRGRRIRKLADNELLGKSGSYTWNGTEADGSKAPIGIYLLVMECVHPDGEHLLEKESCVLGTRW